MAPRRCSCKAYRHTCTSGLHDLLHDRSSGTHENLPEEPSRRPQILTELIHFL
jgi:hypothetical protein